MTQPIQSRTRLQLIHSIGRNIQDVIISSATATVDNASLQDTYGLAKGGDDEYNGRQVVIYTPAGSIVAGEKSWVSDFAIATFDATVAPVFSASITDNDAYEMWKVFTREEIEELIDQAIIEVTDDALLIKETEDTYTAANTYLYDCLTSFVSINRVDYCYNIATSYKIHDCDVVWDELVDGDVTASLDTALKKEGTGCLKLVVAAGCAANDILATMDISSLDISDCDKIEIWIYSTVALDAGDIQVLLDNTAQCASAVEALDIPATSANTWTRHIISLANPQSDTAIISVGLKMVTDKGAFTLYADDILAIDSKTREWRELPVGHWRIAKGSTNYLELTPDGLDVTGTAKALRLTGLQKPSLLTADSTACEVDPAWVIAFCTARALVGHAKSPRLDIDNRLELAKYWAEQEEKKRKALSVTIPRNTVWV